MSRSKALQIYMKPGVREDDLMLRVWSACRDGARAQDVFRAMLRAGLMAMVESGEMPESVIEECGLEAVVERRRRRAQRPQAREAAAPPAPYYPAPYPYYPPAPQPMAPPMPAPQHYAPAEAMSVPQPTPIPAPVAAAPAPAPVPAASERPAAPQPTAEIVPLAVSVRDAAPPAPDNVREDQSAAQAPAEAVPVRKARIGNLM